SVFKQGTIEEQEGRLYKRDLVKYVLGVFGKYDAVHFGSSHFIEVAKELERFIRIPIVISLIDNKCLYYKRKMSSSGFLNRIFSLYQYKKMLRLYQSNSPGRAIVTFVSKLDARYYYLLTGVRSVSIENGVNLYS